MKLSTSFSTLMRRMSLEDAVVLAKEAGFDAIDFSFFEEKYYAPDGNPALFTELRKFAEDKGIVFNQAHAPFWEMHDFSEIEKLSGYVRQSIKNASLLGIGDIVVHPIENYANEPGDVSEKLFDMNMEYFSQFEPCCEEYGVRIAIENMWGRKKIGDEMVFTHSVCSTPEDLLRYIESLGSEWFVGCLDTGHAMLVGEDPCEFINVLGKKHLKALHIHDVDGKRDLHTIPYYGGLGDWDAIAIALKEIGFDGDFTYEADNFFNPLPNELLMSAAKMMTAVGRSIMGKIIK